MIVTYKRTFDKVNGIPYVDALDNEIHTTGINGRAIKTKKLGLKDDEGYRKKSNGERTKQTNQKLDAERNTFLTRNPVVSQKGANTGCC